MHSIRVRKVEETEKESDTVQSRRQKRQVWRFENALVPCLCVSPPVVRAGSGGTPGGGARCSE